MDSLAALDQCVRFPFGSPLHKENRIKPVYKVTHSLFYDVDNLLDSPMGVVDDR